MRGYSDICMDSMLNDCGIIPPYLEWATGILINKYSAACSKDKKKSRWITVHSRAQGRDNRNYVIAWIATIKERHQSARNRLRNTSAAEGQSIKLTFSLRTVELSILVDSTGLNGQRGRIPKANRNYLLGSTLCSLARREGISLLR